MRKISILSVLILVGCATDRSIPQDVHNPCSNGNPPPSVACINPDTLAAMPDRAHSGNGQIFNAFLTSGTNELNIDSEAFAWVKHRGGHAWGQLRNDLTVGNHYKYNIHNLTTKKDNDPDIMIDY